MADVKSETGAPDSPGTPAAPAAPSARSGAGAKRSLFPPIAALFNITVLIFLLVAAVVILKNKREDAATPAVPSATDPRGDESILSVTLFFGGANAFGLVAERREIPVGPGGFDNAVRLVLEELVRGPRGEGTPVLPRDTHVLGVFHDKDGVLFLDFDRALLDGPWEGSSSESAALDAIRQTIAVNFDAVRGVRILVEGKPVESLGGHVGVEGELSTGDEGTP